MALMEALRNEADFMATETEFFDVVIVGAGLSGIGAAYFLKQQCPDKTFTILEGRAVSGGTWDLFRYPGIRSDSSMLSLGYSFKPWLGDNHLADGASILNYIREAADENGIDQHIQYSHKVLGAEWSTADATWTLAVEQDGAEGPKQIQCHFLLLCAGYYSYENPYTPDFKGRDQFEGEIIHPQNWPEDYSYRDKKIVLIGSGATAVTLVPELAKEAGHVTLLQRSPSFMLPRSTADWRGNFWRRVLPLKWAHRINRRRNIDFTKNSGTNHEKHLKKCAKRLLNSFAQNYRKILILIPILTQANPLDQRLCPVPNGNLFEGIRNGKVSIETDHIDRFTKLGLLLKSGKELSADIIITATGLNMKVMGDIAFKVDDKKVDFSETVAYKGLMVSDVPNFVYTFGYINTSWTLRADLVAHYATKLINYLKESGNRICTPRLSEKDKDNARNPFVIEFTPGYLKRSFHLLPKQGEGPPWFHPQDYQRDLHMLHHEPINDGVLEFQK